MTFQDKTRQEVWKTLRALNDSWTKGDGSGLTEYFHPDMVAITPMDRERRVGKDECMEGWIGFVNATTILSWKELDPQIQLFNNSAVVTYYYDMSYELSSKIVHTSGRDMFTFVKEHGKWLAVANQFSPYPD
jgi:hypothetical protein